MGRKSAWNASLLNGKHHACQQEKGHMEKLAVVYGG
jgi:hypothetical protein